MAEMKQFETKRLIGGAFLTESAGRLDYTGAFSDGRTATA